MLDLLEIVHQLDARIDDAVLMLEEGRQPAHADVTVLVDGHAEHGAAVFAVPGRIVGPASEEGDAEGCAADDHATSRAGWDERRMARASTAGASARDSGVPISMKAASPAGMARNVPAGEAA